MAFIYSGTSVDSDTIKTCFRKEEDWMISWNEARLRNLANHQPPPFATFVQLPTPGLAPAAAAPLRPPSAASSFASALRSSRSHGALRDPIHGKPVGDVVDGRNFQTSHKAFFKDQPPLASSTSSLASRIPDDATLDALLMRRSRARGRGGHATKVIDKVEHRVWTVLYTS